MQCKSMQGCLSILDSYQCTNRFWRMDDYHEQGRSLSPRKASKLVDIDVLARRYWAERRDGRGRGSVVVH
jgi:hypothetical protein